MQQDYKSIFYASDDGLNLHIRNYEPSEQYTSQMPLVCLPGLSRSARDFHQIAMYFSKQAKQQRQVIVFEYRGRGESAWDKNPESYNILREAQDIIEGLDALSISKASFIGTSRGGLIIHILATLQNHLFDKIIFNDIGPKIEIDGLLEIQKYLDSKTEPQSWQEAANLQKTIHQNAFTDFSNDDWLEMAHEIYVDQNGNIQTDFDPKILDSLKSLSKDSKLPTLWDAFTLLLDKPLLCIRGQNSNILSNKTVREMLEKHSQMQAYEVPNQGHVPVLHHRETLDVIETFLNNI